MLNGGLHVGSAAAQCAEAADNEGTEHAMRPDHTCRENCEYMVVVAVKLTANLIFSDEEEEHHQLCFSRSTVSFYCPTF